MGDRALFTQRIGAQPSRTIEKPVERTTQYWVGSREFDPVHVGFDTQQGLNQFQVLNSNQQIQLGNSNRGHSFGTTLASSEKLALLEFLETL